MSQKIKHSKVKNPGILFELLTRQITVDVLNDNKDSASMGIIKKYFNENTELGRELELYKILMEENYGSSNKAERLVDATIKSRKKLNNSVLRREKYNLIKEIKEHYKVEDFFKARISNYRVLASIYKLFLSESTSTVFDPKEEIDSKFSIVEHITRKRLSSKQKESKIVAEYQKQDKDLRLLSYQILVDNFNKKYKTLNSMQRNLLKEYINNISNTNSLREFVDSEVIKIKKILSKFLPKIEDEVTKIKLKEAINQTDTLTKGSIVKDKQVVALMRYYELMKELYNVTK